MLMHRGRAGCPSHEHERRHVVQHAAQAADEAVAADRRIVMHGDAAGERGVVVDVHVAAQQRAVGHDDAVCRACSRGRRGSRP